MSVSRALWESLGFESAYDFELLERATKCRRCGDKLRKFARYRLRDKEGKWTDVVVCPPCKDLCNGKVGFAELAHQGLHQESLF